MSQLTQGAKDLLAAEERLKTNNGATNWLIDQIAGSVQDDGRGGTKTTGGWGWIGDRLGLNSTEIRERKGATNQRIDVDKTIAGSNRTREQLEETLGRPLTTSADVGAALVRFQENKDAKDKETARTQQVTDSATAHTRGLEVLAAQNEASDRRADATNRISLAQMSLAELRASNQMEIAQMNNQLQMRREDSRDARNERKDRQAMIMQLMQGLSQMGASIAI